MQESILHEAFVKYCAAHLSNRNELNTSYEQAFDFATQGMDKWIRGSHAFAPLARIVFLGAYYRAQL